MQTSKEAVNQRFIESINFLLGTLEGISKGEFAEVLRLGKSKFSEILNGRMNVGVDVIGDLFLHYNVNPTWVLTGVGDMMMPRVYNSETNNKNTTDQIIVESNSTGKPLIPLDALAGNGTGGFTIMDHDIKEYYNVPEFNHADFMIKVSGASMQPKYYGGDVVACKIVNDWTFFQWNRVYVLDTSQGAIVKRVKQGSDDDHLLLISENKNYEPFEIAKTDLNGLALVIGVIRLE